MTKMPISPTGKRLRAPILASSLPKLKPAIARMSILTKLFLISLWILALTLFSG